MYYLLALVLWPLVGALFAVLTGVIIAYGLGAGLVFGMAYLVIAKTVEAQ